MFDDKINQEYLKEGLGRMLLTGCLQVREDLLIKILRLRQLDLDVQ